MIKVEQKETDQGTGDCMRAAIASVLETDLEAVPHLTRTEKEIWFPVMYYFMIAYGYKYSGHYHPQNQRVRLAKKYSFDGYYLATLPSRNYPEEENITHMVVMDSDWNVAHDPHPSKSWQDEYLKGSQDLRSIYCFRKFNETDKEYWNYFKERMSK